jgi:cupin fold WbuC family metalloprotein
MAVAANPNEALPSVDAEKLDFLIEQAGASPRKRSHLLLHSGPGDQVQRLLIAAQPGTYIRPHRHSEQWEMLVMQRGIADILIFGEDGEVLGRRTLDRASPVVQSPRLQWHNCVVREPDTLLFEIKPGPYRANEFATWAPEEGQAAASALLRWTESAKVGQKWHPG